MGMRIVRRMTRSMGIEPFCFGDKRSHGGDSRVRSLTSKSAAFRVERSWVERKVIRDQRVAVAANFLTMASSSLRSLSFKFVE